MKVEIGKAYRLYGRMDGMKKMKPVSKDHFVTNLIYADIYECNSEEKKQLMERELTFVNTQGTFEFRIVPGWEVKL